MSAFMALPDDQRFAMRLALEAAGSSCESYEGGGFTLAIMRGKFCSVDDTAKKLGLSLVPNGLRYFPLGTAQVAEEFRHWCPHSTTERGHAPGFWLFATYRPAD